MLDIGPQDTDKLLAADDQQLVQALPADRADPTLGDGIGVGRLHRCADDLGTGRAPHVIERPGELGVPVADQELERGGLVIEDGGDVTSLLGNPPPSRMSSDARQVHPSAGEFDEEQDTRRKKTVSTVKKSQATIPAACWRRNADQVLLDRRGAESSPWRRSVIRIAVAEMRTPEPKQFALDRW
jgi:hypothetical protein